jgi:hypothetical protein
MFCFFRTDCRPIPASVQELGIVSLPILEGLGPYRTIVVLLFQHFLTLWEVIYVPHSGTRLISPL